MPAVVGGGGVPWQRPAANIDWSQLINPFLLGAPCDIGVHAGIGTWLTPGTVSGSPAVATVSAIPGSWAAPASFPNATNTGVPTGTLLTAVPGSATSGPGWTWNGTQVRSTGNGVTISGLDIQSSIDASANTGVTIKNCLVRGINEGQFLVSLGGGGSILQDCEIGGGADGLTYLGTTVSNAPVGVYSGGNVARNNTLLRLNIHHTSDGIRGDGGTYVKDSFVHTLNCGQVPGVHSDGCQQTTNSGLMEFDHCTMEGGTNDAIFLEIGTSAYSITNCLLTGTSGPDGSASFGVGGKTTNPPFGTVTIQNNTFDVAKLGATIGNFAAGQVVVRSGNVDLSGAPIPGG